MKKILSAILMAMTISFLNGCSNPVDTVKNGTMTAYPQATIGDIFKANFDNGKWRSEKKDGKEYVTFTGKISQKLHDQENAKVKDPTALNVSGTSFAKELSSELELFDKQNTDPKLKEAEYKEKAAFDEEERMERELYKVISSISVDQEIEEKKKIRAAYDKWQDLLGQRLSFSAQHSDKMKAYKLQVCPRLAPKYWWPAGSDVEFKWIVYPDGKKFELSSLANRSWGEYKLDTKDIFEALYGK